MSPSTFLDFVFPPKQILTMQEIIRGNLLRECFVFTYYLLAWRKKLYCLYSVSLFHWCGLSIKGGSQTAFLGSFSRETKDDLLICFEDLMLNWKIIWLFDVLKKCKLLFFIFFSRFLFSVNVFLHDKNNTKLNIITWIIKLQTFTSNIQE